MRNVCLALMMHDDRLGTHHVASVYQVLKLLVSVLTSEVAESIKC